MHVVTESHDQGYAPLYQKARFQYEDTATPPGPESVDDVAQAVLDKTDVMGEAQCYVNRAKFNALHILLENIQLYSLNKEEMEDWWQMKKWIFEEGIISLVLWEVPSFIIDMFEAGKLQELSVHVVELDEKGTVLLSAFEVF